MGMADGGVARVRSGRVPVVPALDIAVPALDVDGTARHLDDQHSANLHRLVSEIARI